MKFEEIEKMWEQDSIISIDNIESCSLNSSQLHAKYHSILNGERNILAKMNKDLRELKLDFRDFLRNQTKEGKDKGYTLRYVPSSTGQKIRSRMFDTKEIPLIIDGEPQISELTAKIELQTNKIKFLEEIMKSIHSRNWSIRNYIEHQKFLAGV